MMVSPTCSLKIWFYQTYMVLPNIIHGFTKHTWFYQTDVYSEDAGGLANSKDPDQTAQTDLSLLSLIRSAYMPYLTL